MRYAVQLRIAHWTGWLSAGFIGPAALWRNTPPLGLIGGAGEPFVGRATCAACVESARNHHPVRLIFLPKLLLP